jgi:RES domain-containing protein
MRLWRIASAAYPVWSAEGARLKGGRWNLPGTPAIYAATSFAAAVLEVLVHLNIGRVPPNLRYVEITVPDDAPMNKLTVEQVAEWDALPAGPSRAVGDRWLRDRTGLVLLVPSVVTRGLDHNAVVNPLHPDFARVTVTGEQAVAWDPRLVPPRP